MPRALRLSSRLLLVLVLLGSRGPLHAGPPGTRYPVAGHEPPVALLHAGKQTYLVTEQSVFRLEHRQFVRKLPERGAHSAGPGHRHQPVAGYAGGAWNCSTYAASPAATCPCPSRPTAPASRPCFKDAAGTVWLGTDGYGVFRLAGGGPEQMLSTPAINAGLATADSSVWIGTNIGLSRWQHGQWTRYNEEGVANNEIPDNLVEEFLPDNRGNLWVLMSAGVSVFAGGGAGAPPTGLPTVKFIGRPGNAVRSVAYAAGTGYLFATDMGLLLLPDQGAGSFERFAPTSDKVEDKALLVVLAAPAAAPALAQVDARQRVWLAAADAVTVLTAKEFRQYVRAARARPPGAAAQNAAE